MNISSPIKAIRRKSLSHLADSSNLNKIKTIIENDPVRVQLPNNDDD